MIDAILVRMPDQLDHFLAASAVVQDYCVQLHKQAAQKQRPANFWLTLEVPNESYFFFWPIFPRMNFVVRGALPNPSRKHWSAVLDLTDIERVWRMAETPQKHIVEAWGIIFGASPQRIPVLGPMQPTGFSCPVDVLIDRRVQGAEELAQFVVNAYQGTKVIITRVDGLRPASLFETLTHCKVYVGLRDGASYMAVAMGRACVELYTDDLPSWWLVKPQSETYRMFYGKSFPVSAVWPIVEEVWRGVTGHADADDELLLNSFFNVPVMQVSQ